MQSVCNKAAIAATPYYEQDGQFILIEHRDNLIKNEIKIDEWTIKLTVTNDIIDLYYQKKEDRNAISEIYKRNFLNQIDRTGRFWKINDSPRIFYEKKPYYKDNDVCVYRRYAVSEVDMDDKGLGFAVDISTAFFSKNSILELPNEELHRLLRRQKEQKGTLLYKGYQQNSKCYFEKFDNTTTLGTAPSVNILGERFESPFTYYKEKQPKFEVSEHDKAVMVSFKNLDNKVYVPADKVFLRLMNEVLPNHIGKMDKIDPIERRNYTNSNFWQIVGVKPFGRNLAGIKSEYYKPILADCGIIPMPNIIFKNNKILYAPRVQSKEHYKNHYRSRRDFLEKNKCFDVFGGNDGSNIFFIVPESIHDNIIDTYEKSILDKVFQLTGQTLEPIRISYDNYMSGIWELKNYYDSGFILFIFEENINEPAIYYNIEKELGDEWSLKRATLKELTKKYQKWQNNSFNVEDKNWGSYIEMTTLSIIQRMNCTPFVVDASRFNYHMHLIIDVSEEGTHFAFSAQIWNRNMVKPIFSSRVFRKFGNKKESINPRFLEDELYKFLSEKSNDIKKFKIEKLLILRDGKFCEGENTAIENAYSKLNKEDLLPNNFSLDFIEYHKTTRKEIRFWEEEGNVLEGSYFLVNPTMAALATTGAGTLNQGTSDPIILISKFSSTPQMRNIVEDVFLSSQFNFSNPRVAQRLTLPIEKADNLLQEKREQEVKRIK